MKPFWKQTTAQGSAVFGPIQATSSEETSVSMGRISGKRQFLDLDTSASNTTELHCYKFAPLSSISGSFNAFFWISNLVGEALKSIFCFYFGAEVKFGASVGVGRAFSRFRPVDPPTNDTQRYEQGRTKRTPHL